MLQRSLQYSKGLLVSRSPEPLVLRTSPPCLVGYSNTIARPTFGAGNCQAYLLKRSLLTAVGTLLQKLATRSLRLSRLKRRARRESVADTSETQTFLIRESPGKGLGAFATRDIAPGDLLISEAPLLRVERPLLTEKIYEAVSSLHPEARRDFWNLFDKEPRKTPEGIFSCNYFEMDGGGGVYKTICRFNHSCTPNCVHFFGGEGPLGELRAARAARAGEELTVAYVDLLAPRRARRAELRRAFGFACGCPACAAAGGASDRRRAALRGLDARLAAAAAAARGAGAGAAEARAEGLRLVPRVLRLLAEEGLGPAEELEARACAAAVRLLAGHPERQAFWARRCAASFGLCAGPGEAEALRGQLRELAAAPPELPPLAPALLGALALVESLL